jgi:hypothetical protein
MPIQPRTTPLRVPWWLGTTLLVAIAVFFLWEEHQAHILGVLPWLLLLACPILHLLGHGGHRDHGGGDRAAQRGSEPAGRVQLDGGSR